MKRIVLTAALAGLIATPAAYAQTLSAEEFVQKAAVSDMFEIESSQLAVEKASNAEVKQFAQQMITDHTKASQELKAAIGESGEDLAVPAMLDAPHREKIEKLSAASGAEFDAMYVDEQVAGHQAALELMSSYAEGGEDEALKAHAQKTQPVIQMHYEHVQKLDASM